MSIEREDGNIIFQCDYCPDVLRTDDCDFPAAWALAYAEGWRVKVIGNEHSHVCPDCNQPQEPFE